MLLAAAAAVATATTTTTFKLFARFVGSIRRMRMHNISQSASALTSQLGSLFGCYIDLLYRLLCCCIVTTAAAAAATADVSADRVASDRRNLHGKEHKTRRAEDRRKYYRRKQSACALVRLSVYI